MAAGVAVVAGLLAVVLSGAPRLTRPVHTAWEPARPLPRGAVAGAGGPAGAWRLASYLVSAGWRENTAGPEPGSLTCPTATTCYVEGDNATSDSGPADMDTMYVSYDGAVSWNALPVPAGITFTSALSCGSAASCAAGALDHGQPVFVSTADGAHSWTIDPLPAGDGQIVQLSCPSATTCAGLVTATPPAPPQQYFTGVKLLATTDGGRRFATSAFPAGAFMQDVSCPTTTGCVAVGVNNIDTPTRGVALTTSDAGAHWSPGTLPAGYRRPIPALHLRRCEPLLHDRRCPLAKRLRMDGYGGDRRRRPHLDAATVSGQRPQPGDVRNRLPHHEDLLHLGRGGDTTAGRHRGQRRLAGDPHHPRRRPDLEPGHLRRPRARAARDAGRPQRLPVGRRHPVPAARRVHRTRRRQPGFEVHRGLRLPEHALAGADPMIPIRRTVRRDGGRDRLDTDPVAFQRLPRRAHPLPHPTERSRPTRYMFLNLPKCGKKAILIALSGHAGTGGM